jgi:hypothetical protein
MMTVVAAERRRSILIATCTALMAVVASASRLNVAQQDLALELEGVALLGAVLTASYRHTIAPLADAFPERIAGVAEEGIGRAFDIAAQQPDAAQADAVVEVARRAFVEGWAASMWVGAAVMTALFGFLAIRSRRRTTQPCAEASAA